MPRKFLLFKYTQTSQAGLLINALKDWSEKCKQNNQLNRQKISQTLPVGRIKSSSTRARFTDCSSGIFKHMKTTAQ